MKDDRHRALFVCFSFCYVC